MTAGVYYLAVTRAANGPVDSGLNEIFFLNGTDVVGPQTNTAIAGWDGGEFSPPPPNGGDSDLTEFDILLGGTVPEPSTWIMTGAAFAFLVLRSIKPSRTRT